MPPIDELTEKRTKNELAEPPFTKLLLKTVAAYTEAEQLRDETIDSVIDHMSSFWGDDDDHVFADLADKLDPEVGGKLKAVFSMMFPRDVPMAEAVRPLITMLIDNTIQQCLRSKPEEPTVGGA